MWFILYLIFCYVIMGIFTYWAGEPIDDKDKMICGFFWIAAPIVSPILLIFAIIYVVGWFVSLLFRI
jgi:hypothetical protein